MGSQPEKLPYENKNDRCRQRPVLPNISKKRAPFFRNHWSRERRRVAWHPFAAVVTVAPFKSRMHPNFFYISRLFFLLRPYPWRVPFNYSFHTLQLTPLMFSPPVHKYAYRDIPHTDLFEMLQVYLKWENFFLPDLETSLAHASSNFLDP